MHLTYLSLLATAMPTPPENNVEREQQRRYYTLNKDIINARRRLLYSNRPPNLRSQTNNTPIPSQNFVLPIHPTQTFQLPLPSPLPNRPFPNASTPSNLAYPLHMPSHVPPFPPAQQFLPILLQHAHFHFRQRIDALCPIQVCSLCA